MDDSSSPTNIPLAPQESNNTITDGDSDYEDLPSPDAEGDDIDEASGGGK